MEIIERKMDGQTGEINIRRVALPATNNLVRYFKHEARVTPGLSYYSVSEADRKANFGKIVEIMSCREVDKEALEAMGVRGLDYFDRTGGIPSGD